MNVIPGDIEPSSVPLTAPEESSLQGFNLVNKRAANMVLTVFGEKPMTKMLQVGGCTGFIDALGKVKPNLANISPCVTISYLYS